MRRLEHAHDPTLRQSVRARMRDPLFEQEYFAAVGQVITGDTVDCGTLARAIRSDQTVNGAGVQLQVDPTQRAQSTKALIETAHRERNLLSSLVERRTEVGKRIDAGLRE